MTLPHPDPPRYDSDDRFTYNEVRTEKTTLIVCTCTRCGAAKVVSHFDGLFEVWEHGHECNTEQAA